MEKILVLGDIHGRTVWKDIIEKENADKVIFLGDYVSTHEHISEDTQISNLNEILNYYDEHKDSVILLRGNHDLQHLGYYWAQCSGLCRGVLNHMSTKEFKHRFLNSTLWIYLYDDILFSHAGVSEKWLKYCDLDFNKLNAESPSEKFGFISTRRDDWCGDSPEQSCTWIRPLTLIENMYEKYTQVVGHTRLDCKTNDIPVLNASDFGCGNQKLFLCDALPQKYLTIEKIENEHKVNPMDSNYLYIFKTHHFEY